MLDALLQDESLLEQKRMKAMSKPKKVNVGSTCPICDSKEPSREHVSRHFSDELLDIVMGFQDPSQCTQCSYKNDKPKNVSIHIALVHSILDHFLSDQELVKSKRETHSAKPQKVNIGNQCPVSIFNFHIIFSDTKLPKVHFIIVEYNYLFVFLTFFFNLCRYVMLNLLKAKTEIMFVGISWTN